MIDTTCRDADSVRYIMLRKLASGLRHTLMGELQSIQFFAELAARLLVKGADESKMRECVDKIPAASQAAVITCHSAMEWLRPEEGSTTAVSDALKECLKLVSDDWHMRGIAATVDVPAAAGEVRIPRAASRELVVATLLVMSDVKPGPIDIHVSAQLQDDEVELRFASRDSKRVAPLPPTMVYRQLTRLDLNLLAEADGVHCAADGEALLLRFGSDNRTPMEVAGQGQAAAGKN